MNNILKENINETEENFNTPLLNSNYRKFPANNSKSNPNPSLLKSFVLQFYKMIKNIFSYICPCAKEKEETHICYFKRFEDSISIQPNYLVEKGNPLIFWCENQEEDVFFNEEEQLIINQMKERIKKCY